MVTFKADAISMLVSIWACLLFRIEASSQRSPPIRKLYHISTAQLQIIPQQAFQKTNKSGSITTSPQVGDLCHEDSFLLRFAISTSSPSTPVKNVESDGSTLTWFTLVLHPSSDLLHPYAKISYHSTNPNNLRNDMVAGAIKPEEALAYSGWVIRESTYARWQQEKKGFNSPLPEWMLSDKGAAVIGWARILIHETKGMQHPNHLEQLTFEGAFQSQGQIWHVKTMNSYQRVKNAHDPKTSRWETHISGGLLAWTEADIGSNLPNDYSIVSSDAGQGILQLGSNTPYDTQSQDKSSASASQNKGQSEPHQAPCRSQNFFYSKLQERFSLFSTPSQSSSAKLNKIFQFKSQSSEQRSNSHGTSTILSQNEASSRLQKRQTLGNDMSGSSSTSNFASSIGSTDGCPTSPKMVYVGIAADCTYVAKYGSPAAAKLAILNNVNTASSVYQKSFNISLGIVEIIIQNGPCPDQAPKDVAWNVGCPGVSPGGLGLNARLNAFSKWRANRGGSDGAGLWHLMTDCASGEEVGVAWLNALCKVDAEEGIRDGVTSGTGVTASTPNEWQVMAHEIGHNFGAIHDCTAGCAMTDGCCPLSTTTCSTSSQFIMAATAVTPTSAFSPCSVGNICTSLKNGPGNGGADSSCLLDPGRQHIIQLGQCGNGVLEPGEECDPGMVASPCCSWGTCKFAPGAKCSDTPCCTSGCQFAPPGTVCRPVNDAVCDVAEQCTGNSAECPVNAFAENGSSCGEPGEQLSCAAGKCTSRDLQCQKAGEAMGLKKACDTSASMDCRIACVDPNNEGQCVIMESHFSDGSPCGCGGWCHNGKCKGGNQADCGGEWRPVDSL